MLSLNTGGKVGLFQIRVPGDVGSFHLVNLCTFSLIQMELRIIGLSVFLFNNLDTKKFIYFKVLLLWL